MKTLVLLFTTTALVTGCATKRYGRMLEVNDAEQQYLTCEQIKVEQAKVEQFRREIDDAKVDMRSIAGFLGDFGIGNQAEKHNARESANQRADDLAALSREKGCS